MSFLQKLYLVDEPRYRQFLLHPTKTSDSDLSKFNQSFLQNKVQELATDDASWAKIGSRVGPILKSGLGGPSAVNSNNNNSGLVQPPSLEQEIKSSFDANLRSKALKFLRDIENVQNVAINGDKIVVNGNELNAPAVDIIEDLVRKRKNLSYPVDSLLQEIAFLGPSILYNNEAKRKIKDFQKSGSTPPGGLLSPLLTDNPTPPVSVPPTPVVNESSLRSALALDGIADPVAKQLIFDPLSPAQPLQRVVHSGKKTSNNSSKKNSPDSLGQDVRIKDSGKRGRSRSKEKSPLVPSKPGKVVHSNEKKGPKKVVHSNERRRTERRGTEGQAPGPSSRYESWFIN